MSAIFYSLCIFGALISLLVDGVLGHGMMLDPPGRASRWRFNISAPANYNDMENFCGGLKTQWSVHNGECGICGDNFGLRRPRPHELGGKYGEGHIVETYSPGAMIPISVRIVANHNGYFVFDICNLDRMPESEECFKQVMLGNGKEKYYLPNPRTGMFDMTVQLPRELSCEHCVLRWHYRSANMWGACEDGTSAVGCGPQEIYRSCADIAIKYRNRWN